MSEKEQDLTKKVAALEAALKAVTDRVDHLDPLIEGKEFMYFRCTHSGLFFPGDYVKEWGRKYGIGLDTVVVSECLDSMYHNFPMVHSGLRSERDVMHPVAVSKAQVQLLFVSQPIQKERMLIVDREDPRMFRRGPLIRAKQLRNPANKIQLAMGETSRKGVYLESESY